MILKFWFIVVLVLAGTCAGRAALFFSDSFDYPVGNNLSGQGGWSDSTTGGISEMSIASGNLSVTGLAGSSGNMAAFSGGGNTIQRAIASPQDVTTYYSFTFTVSSLGHLNNSSGDYVAGLCSSSGGTAFGGVLCLRVDSIDSAKYDIGIATRSSSTVSWSSTSYSLDATVFVVGEYAVISGTGNDASALWLNPGSENFGASSAPAATLTASSGTSDLSTIASFFIRPDTSSSSAVGTVGFDELRVGTTWADVTPIPEPPEWGAVFGFGLLALCGWRVWRQ